jgi:hypothetical protein
MSVTDAWAVDDVLLGDDDYSTPLAFAVAEPGLPVALVDEVRVGPKGRPLTQHQLFMSDALEQLKQTRPDLSAKERFQEANRLWCASQDKEYPCGAKKKGGAKKGSKKGSKKGPASPKKKGKAPAKKASKSGKKITQKTWAAYLKHRLPGAREEHPRMAHANLMKLVGKEWRSRPGAEKKAPAKKASGGKKKAPAKKASAKKAPAKKASGGKKKTGGRRKAAAKSTGKKATSGPCKGRMIYKGADGSKFCRRTSKGGVKRKQYIK